MKTLSNTNMDEAKTNVSDLHALGNPEEWVTICKAWSTEEGWMKSTKAMQVGGKGCLVQVSTQQGEHVAEAVTFVPGICIAEEGTLQELKQQAPGIQAPYAYVGT